MAASLGMRIWSSRQKPDYGSLSKEPFIETNFDELSNEELKTTVMELIMS